MTGPLGLDGPPSLPEGEHHVEADLDVVRVRNSRTPIGVFYAPATALIGLFGVSIPAWRAISIESTYTTLAVLWYVSMVVAGASLAYALTSPIGYAHIPPRAGVRGVADTVTNLWRLIYWVFSRPWAEEVTLLSYRRVLRRLIAEEVGLALSGWSYVSYGLSTLDRINDAGFTLAVILIGILGGYAMLRLFQLQADVTGLREWRRNAGRRAEARFEPPVGGSADTETGGK